MTIRRRRVLCYRSTACRTDSSSVWAAGVGHAAANVTFGVGFTLIASTTSESLAFVAGETGVATLAVVLVTAVLLLTRAKVWQTSPPTQPEGVTRESVAVFA